MNDFIALIFMCTASMCAHGPFAPIYLYDTMEQCRTAVELRRPSDIEEFGAGNVDYSCVSAVKGQ